MTRRFQRISGGVQVNHHSLSDFRVAHGAALDELLFGLEPSEKEAVLGRLAMRLSRRMWVRASPADIEW